MLELKKLIDFDELIPVNSTGIFPLHFPTNNFRLVASVDITRTDVLSFCSCMLISKYGFCLFENLIGDTA